MKPFKVLGPISSTLLPCWTGRKKGGKFQNPEKIVFLKVFLLSFSLYQLLTSIKFNKFDSQNPKGCPMFGSKGCVVGVLQTAFMCKKYVHTFSILVYKTIHYTDSRHKMLIHQSLKITRLTIKSFFIHDA